MAERATVFLLHALGGSARAFGPVIAGFASAAPHLEPVAIDLPGFGGAGPAAGVTVEAMADHVVAVIARHLAADRPARWLLVGHSMGGKVATVVAARTLAGQTPLFGLAGVVLLAGSPPSPEPMAEARRDQMRDWAADGPLDDHAARTFVDANVGGPLPAELDALALADLRRASPEAWTAWLDRGSREDWSDVVGSLPLPALLLAGGEDGDLGEAGQRALNGAVYPRADVRVLPGAGHLLPLERPREVAAAVASFWADRAGLGPAVPPGFARVLASARTSARTRGALAVRALADDPQYRPQVLDAAQLATLRIVAGHVLPQPGPDTVDLAARVDAQLATGRGDGWRRSEMPADPEAYATALDALRDITDLSPAAQVERLRELAVATYAAPGSGFTAAQLAAWFEDARNDLVRTWLAHPAALARIGFDGFANGGDGWRKQGFAELGAGRTEAWEPVEISALAGTTAAAGAAR